MNGVIIVNKADSITSQKVVNMVKHKFNKKFKVGHYGTLDPKATGVLPIAIGKATKLFDLMQDKIKVYRAIFRFGVETDTLDSEGKIINQSNVLPTLSDIQSVLPSFIGQIKQVPPLYSANMVNGVRAYDLARKNVEFELKTKSVYVYKFECIKQINNADFLFEIHCGSGTYIRSLCRDLAYALNTYGFMPLLIRTKSGNFDIQNSISYKELLQSDNIDKYVMSLNEVLEMPSLNIDDKVAFKFGNGMTIIFNGENGIYKVLNQGNLLGLGSIKNNRLKMEIKLDD